MTTDTLRLLLPEIVLMVAAVVMYLGGAFSRARRPWSWIAGAAVVLAAGALATQSPSAIATGPLDFDALAWFGRWLALGFGALMVLLASRPLVLCGVQREPSSGKTEAASVCHCVETEGTPEYLGSLLLTIVGLMLVAGSGELVLLFVGLELISIPTYVLLYLGGRDAPCQEATVKYFFLSILSSAILLYGFSFLYGIAGSTELSAVRAVFLDAAEMPSGLTTLAKLALGLIFAGLCFKIAAVPFHFYAPDVYQGTTYPNAALLSIVPKAAGMLALVRLLVVAMPGMEPYGWRVVLVVSLVTMTLGNVLALWQDNLRRMLAYSSIANAGYLLIGLAVALASGDAPGPWSGVSALGFYLVAYAAATIGAFAVLEYLGRPERQMDGVEELAGLGRTRPLAAGLLALFMFSLTGVPPLAGFWGKLLVFGSALSLGGPWFTGLAIVGVLNAAVAAAYYLRIVAVMYFRAPLATPRAQGGMGAWWAAVLCGLLVVTIGNVFYPAPSSPSRTQGNTVCKPAHDTTVETALITRTNPDKKKSRHPSLPRDLEWRRTNVFADVAIITEGGDNRMSPLREIIPR